MYIYNIREYGSTLYVGMAREKNCCHTVASDQLKSLVVYTDRFLIHTYLFISSVFMTTNT